MLFKAHLTLLRKYMPLRRMYNKTPQENTYDANYIVYHATQNIHDTAQNIKDTAQKVYDVFG